MSNRAPMNLSDFTSDDLIDDAVRRHVINRARELVVQADQQMASPAYGFSWASWSGSAAEILRELVRDA